MQITSTDIARFREIYHERYGLELTEAEAHTQLLALVQLIAIVVRFDRLA